MPHRLMLRQSAFAAAPKERTRLAAVRAVVACSRRWQLVLFAVFVGLGHDDDGHLALESTAHSTKNTESSTNTCAAPMATETEHRTCGKRVGYMHTTARRYAARGNYALAHTTCCTFRQRWSMSRLTAGHFWGRGIWSLTAEKCRSKLGQCG